MKRHKLLKLAVECTERCVMTETVDKYVLKT